MEVAELLGAGILKCADSDSANRPHSCAAGRENPAPPETENLRELQPCQELQQRLFSSRTSLIGAPGLVRALCLGPGMSHDQRFVALGVLFCPRLASTSGLLDAQRVFVSGVSCSILSLCGTVSGFPESSSESQIGTASERSASFGQCRHVQVHGCVRSLYASHALYACTNLAWHCMAQHGR